MDILAQRNAALHNMLEASNIEEHDEASSPLSTERIVAKSGNDMIA